MANLFLGNERAGSVYRLIGNDENALTFALGHCASQDIELRRELRRLCGIRRLGNKQINQVEVRLQRHEPEDGGFTDIEFFLADRFRVIVEAKIGRGTPTRNQLLKYRQRLLDGAQPVRRLVAIVQTRSDALQRSLKGSADLGDVRVLTWSEELREFTC